MMSPGGSMSQVVGLPSKSYKPITNTAWVRPRLCKLQKGCTRLAAASDKVYQLLAHGWWFSPVTPVSSTTKTCHHDIAESGVKHKKKIKSIIMHVLSWTVDMFLRKILPLAMVWMHVTSKKKKNYLRELNIPLFLFHCSLYYSIYYTTELFQHNSGKLNIFSIIQGLIALQNQYMIDTCRNIDILKQLINNSTKYALYIQHSSRKDIRFSRFTCTYQYIKHQNELSSIASQYTK